MRPMQPRKYEGCFYLTPQELKREKGYPLHINVWYFILGGFIAIPFAKIKQGERSLKEYFPENSGIIHLGLREASTLVIIFTEDMEGER